MGERDNARHEAFAKYFRLLEESANESGLPIKDLMGRDIGHHMLQNTLKDNEKPKIYKVLTIHGEFTLDLDSSTATSPFLKEGTNEHFTKTEMVILQTIMAKPRQIFSRDQLADVVTKMHNHDSDPFKDTPEIKQHLLQIRRKLKIPFDPNTKGYPILRSYHGMGTVFLP